MTVVGCSGSFPGPGSAASAYLVQADERQPDGRMRTWNLMLDLGSGSLGPLQKHISLDEIDAVALSHLHADHCLDLCGLYVYLRYRPGGPVGTRPPVFGPAGTAKRLARAYDLPMVPGMHDELDIYAWTQKTAVKVGPMVITPYLVRHPVPTFAIRVEGPSEDGEGTAVIAYSGDTDECQGLIDAAQDADLFLCEAGYCEGRDTMAGIHLTGRRAALMAAKAHVKHMLLTHIPPWNDPKATLAEAVETWEGAVELAHPDMVRSV